MDLFSIFGQVLGAVWFLIPFAILAVLFKSPWVKGVVGEFAVNVGVKLFLDKKRYHLLKNVTIPFDGSTTQIDHIIVSIYGVFVVETKNMKGWIFGGENQKNWTQRIFKHSQKFQNPLHQNYKHVKALAALLELEETKFRSVVVFMGESTFKTPMPRKVTYGFGLIRFIRSHDIRVLSPSECRQIERI